jgi:hypothetical protein
MLIHMCIELSTRNILIRVEVSNMDTRNTISFAVHTTKAHEGWKYGPYMILKVGKSLRWIMFHDPAVLPPVVLPLVTFALLSIN